MAGATGGRTARSGGPDRPARADAVRNRAAIVRAAAAVFAERGRGVDVREIARCAGVGMGTLYRHFPTKDELLDTVLVEDFSAWARSARADATAQPDPWRALSEFMADALAHQARHRASRERLADTWGSAAMDRCHQELHPVVDDLVRRGHAAGVLRAGVASEDVLLVLIGLGRVVELTATSQPLWWRRQLCIALDGLRAGSESLPTDGGPDGQRAAPGRERT